MLHIAWPPFLFQTNSMPLFSNLVFLYFDPIQKGLSVGWHAVLSVTTSPSFTDSHIERQVQRQQGVTRVQSHLSCVLLIIQEDAWWKYFAFLSLSQEQEEFVGRSELIWDKSYTAHRTLCSRWRRVLVQHLSFSYQESLSRQRQLVLWSRISHHPHRVYVVCWFIITVVVSLCVMSIFGREKSFK